MSMLTDITKHKEVEANLEKIEIVGRQEIHHRIKNNLQIISSLLDLQAEKFRARKNIKDFEVLETFRESQDRVISMALIHEELYRSDGVEKLDSLGLQLVTSLVGQLNGELKINRNFGSEFIIRFNITEKDNKTLIPVLEQIIE
jgi:two-component sensor histidine kinase